MAVTAAQVKELREKTGVGMMECKKALVENGGDLEKAILWLRERGLSRAAKKAGRTAAEGVVSVLVSEDKSTGVLVEVNSETDFAAKNEAFVKFAAEVAKIALANETTSVEQLAECPMGGGTVGGSLTDLIATIGENMTLRRATCLKAKSGVVTGYSHMGGKIGTLVVLEGEASDKMTALGQDLAMHVAAASPRYLKRDEVSPTELEQEKELAKKKLAEQGKPPEIIEKIMVGQINKFYSEVCLVDQPFIKEPKTNIEKLLKSSGTNASLEAFARFQLGEGIEKKEENFADEVAAQLKK